MNCLVWLVRSHIGYRVCLQTGKCFSGHSIGVHAEVSGLPFLDAKCREEDLARLGEANDVPSLAFTCIMYSHIYSSKRSSQTRSLKKCGRKPLRTVFDFVGFHVFLFDF